MNCDISHRMPGSTKTKHGQKPRTPNMDLSEQVNSPLWTQLKLAILLQQRLNASLSGVQRQTPLDSTPSKRPFFHMATRNGFVIYLLAHALGKKKIPGAHSPIPLDITVSVTTTKEYLDLQVH